MANPPTWSNVKLLLHCDGTDASQTFTDSSTSAHGLTAAGDAQIDTAQSKYGGASGLFDGDGDYVYSAQSDDFNLGSSDFTIEAWVRFNSITGFSKSPLLVTTWNVGASIGWSFYYDGDSSLLGFDFQDTDDNYVWFDASWSPSVDTWYHVAVSKSGTSLRFFVDGTQIGTTKTMSVAVEDPVVGIYVGGGLAYQKLDGWLDDVRVTVGEAAYTSNFVAPTEALPDGEEAGNAVGPGKGAVVVTGRTPIVYPVVYAATASIQFGEETVYAATAIIQITGSETYAATADIEISAPVYAVTASIRVSGEETYAVTATISVQGTAHTAANRQSIKWSPVVAINGADVSGRLTGEVSIECNEDASNLCTCTLIPAAGTLEPLAYLGQTLTATWSDEGDGTYVAHSVLMFSGVISDTSWDPDTGLLTIEATSDLQGKVERMDRAGITAMIPSSTWSDVIFEQEADPWQYAQDRLSTTTHTLWQDAMGAIRTAPLATKVSPDFTFTDAGLFSDTLAIETASLRDLVNEITIALDYRWARKRHRQIKVRWIGVQDVCTFLLNPFTLCTREMVEDAANGADWSVVGGITFNDVWPPGAYQCGSGVNGVMVWGYDPIVAQLDSMQDLSQWTMGATWIAARRYVQRVTETHTVVVQCRDSIDAVGRLPKSEDYGAESDVDVSDWTETDASEGPPAGSTQLASSDWAIDTDDEGEIDRDAIDDALEVAMAAARGDILRSHRQTRVSFDTVFQPMVDLSHTVRVNADNLQATGRVSRLAHRLDADSGEATTTVEIAVSRHEGAGLSVSDTITAPAKPAVTDGAEIPTTLTLRQWTGGSVADYLNPGFEGDEYSEVEDEAGFFTNVVFDSLTNTNIGTDEPNPILARFIYPVQFVVNYPEITGTYIDAAESVAATTIEVAVPEDELVCTQ